MTSPGDTEPGTGETASNQPTHGDIFKLYQSLLLTHGCETERVARVATASLPKLTGITALRAFIFGDKRERPEPIVTKVKELRVGLPVLPANEKHSQRGGSLVLQEGEEGTKLLFIIGRTIYNPRPSSEMDHIHSATDLSKELPIDSSSSPLADSAWYEYLSKVSDYLSRDSVDASSHHFAEFISQNHDLLVRVEQELGAQNPAADHFGRN